VTLKAQVKKEENYLNFIKRKNHLCFKGSGDNFQDSKKPMQWE